jgi:hypothetical protein
MRVRLVILACALWTALVGTNVENARTSTLNLIDYVSMKSIMQDRQAHLAALSDRLTCRAGVGPFSPRLLPATFICRSAIVVLPAFRATGDERKSANFLFILAPKLKGLIVCSLVKKISLWQKIPWVAFSRK